MTSCFLLEPTYVQPNPFGVDCELPYQESHDARSWNIVGPWQAQQFTLKISTPDQWWILQKILWTWGGMKKKKVRPQIILQQQARICNIYRNLYN
jgi:hypothetical protein